MITYPVVQDESISCVSPRWKCRHSKKNENSRTATDGR